MRLTDITVTIDYVDDGCEDSAEAAYRIEGTLPNGEEVYLQGKPKQTLGSVFEEFMLANAIEAAQ